MKGLTHIAGGAMAAAITTSLFFPAASPLSVAAALTSGVVGGLAPDVDHPKSTINHELKVTGKIVSFFFSHRGFFHTPFLYLLLGMLVYFSHPVGIAKLIAVSFFAGIASHLLLDSLNPTGIPVFYPLSKKKILTSENTYGRYRRQFGVRVLSRLDNVSPGLLKIFGRRRGKTVPADLYFSDFFRTK